MTTNNLLTLFIPLTHTPNGNRTFGISSTSKWPSSYQETGKEKERMGMVDYFLFILGENEGPAH